MNGVKCIYCNRTHYKQSAIDRCAKKPTNVRETRKNKLSELSPAKQKLFIGREVNSNIIKNLTEPGMLVSYVDYDYSRDYDCENYGCNDEGICRCSTIINKEIETIYKDNLIQRFLSEDSTNDDYENIMQMSAHHDIFNTENYELETEYSYYGEEVVGVNFYGKKELSNFLRDVLDYHDGKTIPYLKD